MPLAWLHREAGLCHGCSALCRRPAAHPDPAPCSLLLTRLAESSAEVDRLRALLASGEQAHLSPADAQRLEAEEAAATFRLKVVQRRVEEHGPRAAARRREMEAKLASDKRLVSALAGG